MVGKEAHGTACRNADNHLKVQAFEAFQSAFKKHWKLQRYVMENKIDLEDEYNLINDNF